MGTIDIIHSRPNKYLVLAMYLKKSYYKDISSMMYAHESGYQPHFQHVRSPRILNLPVYGYSSSNPSGLPEDITHALGMTNEEMWFCLTLG